MFCELHFHTQETSRCGKVPAAEGIRAFREYGYECVVVTDHLYDTSYNDYYSGKLTYEEMTDRWLSGYRVAKAEGDRIGVKVFLGCEINFDEGVANNDYLVYGLTEKMFYEYREMWTWNEATFKEFADKHGLFVAQAHPFRGGCAPCPPEFIHGVEVFNSHPRHEEKNHLAMEMWLSNDLIPMCGSDYHDPDAITGCGMDFNRNADSIQDIVDMLFKKEFKLIIPGNYICPARLK